MVTNLANLSAESHADFRKILKINNRKTLYVISVFILMYVALGLLIDTYIYMGYYPNVSVKDILFALITFSLFPKVTLITAGVAIASLMITLFFHNKLMLLGTEYREVQASSQSLPESQLYHIVEEIKIAASLNFMPRVYLIEADYMNAFASGFSEKSAMVAITRGLMEKLTRSELQAVMAHEISHIRHMDIKLTLIASLLANLMLMVLDIFFYNIIFSSKREDNRSRNSIAGIIMLLRYLLPVINVLLLLYLSRTREYMADAGSVELLRDNNPLASALLKIHRDHHQNLDVYNTAYQNTPHENVRREAYIFDPLQAGIHSQSSFADLFSTHPRLEDRLAALGFKFNEKS